MHVKRNYSNEKLCPSFRMEDGTEIRNSCWRLQEQTVNGEATGAHAGRHAAFTATCYFCWFLFIVNWTLKKDHPKINIAFFTSPLLGGSCVLQRRILSEKCLEWVLDFMRWPMVRGWDKAAFRKPSAESGRGWSPAWAVWLMHTQSSKCTGWRRQGSWSDCREATGMSLCPSRSLFSQVLSSLPTADSIRSRELEGLGKYRACI